MSDLLALDVAILPPPAVGARAIAISADLGRGHPDRLLLDDSHLPHITLVQQFVRVEELEPALERVADVLRNQPPLPLTITGCVRTGHSIWMAVERTPPLAELHERLMESLRGFERSSSTAAAFFEHDARVGDVIWVDGYRLKSSFGAFRPHITLGVADEPPVLEPLAFEAATVAACHLGRYCACRAVLRRWELT